MKKICIAIFLMLVIPALATSASTIETNQNISMKTNVVMLGTGDDPVVVDLVADGGSPETAFIVGEVHVWDTGVGGTLHVKYMITLEGWEMTLTHLHIGFELDDFPCTKQGNPKIGKFDYQMAHDPPVTTYTYDIPYNGETMIATHADVQEICGYEGDLAGFEAGLPDQVSFKVTYPYGGGPAYFPHTYINGLDDVQMDVYSWCVDTDHVIYQNTWYTANIYSSYETMPLGLIEYPENLDMVNWILNQGYVGQASPGCSGTYTYGDVQRAIWELVEDNPSASGLGSWSQCRVDEILAAANADGEGYTPGCGEIIGVILVPVDGQQVIIAQVIVGEVVVPCIPIYCGETAWGDGTEFTDGKSWAMYFEYDTNINNPVGRQIYLKGFIQQFLARIARIFEQLKIA